MVAGHMSEHTLLLVLAKDEPHFVRRTTFILKFNSQSATLQNIAF